MARTLTWDRGIELTLHQASSAATGVPVYSCDAYCPWQRGTDENTNGLLCQYFPKKTDLSLITAQAPAASVTKLNRRPREAPAWHSPLEVYSRAAVAMTA